MNIIRWIKGSMADYDLFGYDFSVRFEKNKDNNYPTACGGFISILLKITVLYVLYKAFNDLLDSETEITSTVRRIGLTELYSRFSNNSQSEHDQIVF